MNSQELRWLPWAGQPPPGAPRAGRCRHPGGDPPEASAKCS